MATDVANMDSKPRETPPGSNASAVESDGSTASSSSTTSSPQRDLSRDLPDELLAQGWRRFWSKRESRPYYFNKLTNQSLWEMPSLGKKRPPASRVGQEPAVKRQHSTAGAAWNFSVPSNCIMQERRPLRTFLPHPEAELLRAQLIGRLRQQFLELCASREGIQQPPSTAFNHWLLERRLADRGDDPLLPSNCDSELSRCLFRSIISCLPVQLPQDAQDLRKQLYMYAEASKAMIESRMANPESRKIVKWNVEQTFQFLRQQPSRDDCAERLAHLRRTCQPHIEESARESVERICVKVYHLSAEYAKKIRELCERLFRIADPADPWRHLADWGPPGDRKVRCHPAQICSPPPLRLPVIETGSTERLQFVRYRHNSNQLALTHQHLAKMQQLYALNCRDEDPGGEKFYLRLWCLLSRYQAFVGQNCDDQAALPVPVLELLTQHFGVTFELFASPLDCYYRQYCSPFADTDCFFGSRGPFFDLRPTEGSFQANPPCSEELMLAMVDRIEDLLTKASGPLSFVVFVPDCREPPAESLRRLEASAFNRRQVSILPRCHSYRHSMQHCLERDEDLHAVSSRGTLVVFVQNDAGFTKWTPTSEKVRELLNAFRVTAA